MTEAEMRRLAEAALADRLAGKVFPPSLYEFTKALGPATVLALLDRLNALRAFHTPVVHTPPGIAPQRFCAHDSRDWPCPTIQILDGES